MASESRAITVVEQQKNGSKEPAKQNIKNDDSEEGFTVIRNFRKVYKRNWRQMSAISSGLLLLLSSGVFILYSILELRNRVFLNESKAEMKDFLPISAWFIGAPIGFIVCSLIISYLFKRTIYILTSFILGISGVLIATNADNIDVVTLGRFIAGIAHGIVYQTIIIHSGEIAVREVRLLIIRPICVSPLVAMCIAMAYIKYFYPEAEVQEKSLYLYLGFITFFYAVVALIAAPIYTTESVPWLLQNGNNETTAFQTWLKLQDKDEANINENSPIKREFDELRAAVNDEKRANDKHIFGERNLKKILVAVSTRFIIVTVYNIGLFAVFSFAERQKTFDPFAIIMLRLILGLIVVYIEIDKLNADTETYRSIVGFGFELFLLNIFAILEWSNWFITVLWMLTLLSFATIPVPAEFQSNVYLSEAFPFLKKTWSITIALIIEYLIHIGYIVITLNVPFHCTHYLQIGFSVVLMIFPWIQRRFLSEQKMMTTREERKEARQLAATAIINA